MSGSDHGKDFETKFDEAVEKWLDKKYAQFGKWTLGLIGVSIFILLLQLIMYFDGGKKADIEAIKSIIQR